MPRGKREPLEDRLWRYLERRGTCLVWAAAFNSDGYGTIGTGDGRTDKVHRVYWRLYRGPIPSGAYVLHKCPEQSKRCVEHTYLGDHPQNMRDAAEDGLFSKRPQNFGQHRAYDWTGQKRDGKRGKLVVR